MERESSVKISATVYKQLEQQSKSVAYTDNGTYNVIPDPGYFLSNVNVEVHVDQNLSVISELSAVISGLNDLIATITSLTINENGTYTPPEGVLGYNSINVNVVGGGEDFTAISGLSLNFTNNEPLPELYYQFFNNVRGFLIKGNVNSVSFKEGNLTLVRDMWYAFANCSSLTSITFEEGALTLVTLMTNTFQYCPSLTSIIFPEGALTQVTDMRYAFFYCSSISSITFPEGAFTKVEVLDVTFYNCYKLTSIIFPEGTLKQLRVLVGTFSSCSSLTSISFPEGALTQVTSTGSTFFNCSSLKSVTIPAGAFTKVTWMANQFHKCKALQDLVIYNLPNINLTNIGFSTCTALTISSLENILNALPVSTSGYKCTIGTTNLSKLSEEQIAIATNKGWTLN